MLYASLEKKYKTLLPDNDALLLLEVKCQVWPISAIEEPSLAMNLKEVKVMKKSKSIRIFNKLSNFWFLQKHTLVNVKILYGIFI